MKKTQGQSLISSAAPSHRKIDNEEKDHNSLRNSTLCTQGESSNSKALSSSTAFNPDYYQTLMKLSNVIRELFIEIRKIILTEDQESIIQYQEIIHMNDDLISTTDALLIVPYIRQIFLDCVQLKNNAVKELAEKKDKEANDYEPMLQKLEAEVRQHIRIEQQLKLYAESAQSKADELEKQIEELKQELNNTKHETEQITEKSKKKDLEIESLKKKLKANTDLLQNIEHQAESISGLKNKIKELQRSSTNDMPKPTSYNINLKNINSSVLETHADHSKNALNILQKSNISLNDNGNKKSSRYSGIMSASTTTTTTTTNSNVTTTTGNTATTTILGINEVNKLKQSLIMDKEKENIDSQRLIHSKGKDGKKKSNQDNSIRADRSGSNLGKPDESKDESSKKKKQPRLDQKGSKERISTKDVSQEERLSTNLQTLCLSENFDSCNNGATKGNNSSKYLNTRESEESDIDKKKLKTKSNLAKNNTIKQSQPLPQERKSANQAGNNIPKPSKAYDNTSYGYILDVGKANNNGQPQSKKDNSVNVQELRASMTSPKKQFEDLRSQSVDAANKLYRQLKTIVEHH